MFSPSKLALFAFISFAALVLAIPSPADHLQPQDPKALLSNANVAIERALLPLSPFYLPFARLVLTPLPRKC
jgi:hypothetical protein